MFLLSLWAILSWVAFISIDVTLMLMGWILIPIAVACSAYVMTDPNLSKPNDGPIYHFTWKFMWLWDNQGDGIANTNYKKFDSLAKQIIYWSASRNPVNNLRFVPLLSCKIDPKKVKWIGSHGQDPMAYETKTGEYWYFAWNGLYTNFRKQYKTKDGKIKEFWIGWKIWPIDINGVSAFRKDGAGFAIQWKER